MGIFDYFPYTNLHELNLDWIVKIVRKFINESELHFDNIDEEVKYLNDNFKALKEYVMNYFDSLDVKQAVSDKLDEMLDSGELEAIISQNILNYSPLSNTYDGITAVRIREEYRKIVGDENSQNKGFQNGLVYSPSNNYSETSNDRILYIWQTWGDNIDTKLYTFDVSNNTVIDRLPVTGAGHGGSIARKGNKLYSITSESELLIFDISQPRLPVLEDRRVITGGYKGLVGALDDSFLVYDSNYKVYETLDFIEYTYQFDISESNYAVVQDICIDTERMLIYKVTYRPNTIHIYSAIDGEKLATMEVPSIINCIGVQESEMISVHGKYIYYGGISAVGCGGSTKIDFAMFVENLNNKNITRRQTYNEASMRYMYVNYTNGDPLNKGISGEVNYSTFKYIEDAQNASKGLNQVTIVIQTDYPESFYLYRDGTYSFQSNKTGAFRIECKANIYGLADRFLGLPHMNLAIKTWIFCAQNSAPQFRSLPTFDLGISDVAIWTYRSRVVIYSRDGVEDVFIEESELTGQAILVKNVYVFNSHIEAYAILLTNGNTIHIDDTSTIEAPLVSGATAERLNINTLDNFDIPVQGTLLIQGGASIYPPFPVYITSDTTANLTYAYLDSSGNRVATTYTLTRTTQTHFSGGNHEFNSHKYKIVFTANKPTGLARFLAQE